MPTQEYKAVIDRVSKLLALSKSPNEHEAAAAAAKAADLMLRHNLSRGDIPTDKADEEFCVIGNHKVVVGNRIPKWKNVLMTGIGYLTNAEVLFLETTYPKGKHLSFIGSEGSVAVAVKMFEYLADAIESQSKNSGLSGRSQFNEFKMGAAGALQRRLRERRVELENKGLCDDDGSNNIPGIVLANHFKREQDAINKYLEDVGINPSKNVNLNFNPRSSAYSAGVEAGNSIGIDPQINRHRTHNRKQLRG